jgi:hypothetical protein
VAIEQKPVGKSGEKWKLLVSFTDKGRAQSEECPFYPAEQVLPVLAGGGLPHRRRPRTLASAPSHLPDLLPAPCPLLPAPCPLLAALLAALCSLQVAAVLRAVVEKSTSRRRRAALTADCKTVTFLLNPTELASRSPPLFWSLYHSRPEGDDGVGASLQAAIVVAVDAVLADV